MSTFGQFLQAARPHCHGPRRAAALITTGAGLLSRSPHVFCAYNWLVHNPGMTVEWWIISPELVSRMEISNTSETRTSVPLKKMSEHAPLSNAIHWSR